MIARLRSGLSYLGVVCDASSLHDVTIVSPTQMHAGIVFLEDLYLTSKSDVPSLQYVLRGRMTGDLWYWVAGVYEKQRKPRSFC